MGRARLARAAAAAFLTACLLPAATGAADPIPTITLAVSPSPAYPDQTVTLVVTLTPAPATATQVEVWDTFDHIGEARAFIPISTATGTGTLVSQPGSFLVHPGTHALTGRVRDGAGTIIATSEPLEHVVLRPQPVVTLELTPSTNGPRSIVTASVAVIPGPAIEDAVGWLNLSNAEDVGRGMAITIAPDGTGTAAIDTTNWATGLWTGSVAYAGSVRTQAATSAVEGFEITAPTAPPPSGPAVRSISAGGTHACALDDAGHASCWGHLLEAGEANGSDTFRAVSAGAQHTCAVRTTGAIACWGEKIYGSPRPPDGSFLDVEIGDDFGCGLRVDQTLACWGPPEYMADSLNPPHGSFTAMSFGGANSCAIDGDGELACWGAGFGVEDAPAGAFDQVSVGSGFACGLRPLGAIECWGLFAPGVPAGTYRAVSAGHDHACGIRSDGAIRCWGNTEDGPPETIAGSFTELDSGSAYMCARHAAGDVECWGGHHVSYAIVPELLEQPPIIGAVGEPYAFDFRTSSIHPSPGFAVVGGALPPGMTLTLGGRLAGTPSASGVYAFVVEASNGIAPVIRQSLELDIAPAAAFETGPVSIASGASVVRDAVVDVDHPATAATAVRLSNDGTHWVTAGYAGRTSWSLVDVAAGGIAADGIKRVWVSWRDALGTWSPPSSDTVVLDRSAPSATIPTQRLYAGSSVVGGKVPVRLAWKGSDAVSGIARYELAERRDDGAWTTVATNLTTTSVDRRHAPGHSYRVRIRAVDRAGHVSAWMTGPTFRVAAVQESNAAVRYVGSWRLGSAEPYWGDRVRRASIRGARATYRFTGRSIAWVSTTGPTRGIARVYVNGSFAGSVDLRATTVQGARVVFSRNWSTSAQRSIEIRVTGTPGRPRVDVDAFVTVR